MPGGLWQTVQEIDNKKTILEIKLGFKIWALQIGSRGKKLDLKTYKTLVSTPRVIAKVLELSNCGPAAFLPNGGPLGDSGGPPKIIL